MRIDGYDDSYLNRIYPDNVSAPERTGGGRDQAKIPQETQTAGKAEKESAWDTIARTPRKNTDIADVKISLGNRDDSLVGLANLGLTQSSIMRKAVSDMQKDSILHEYQYFVGTGVVRNNSVQDTAKVLVDDEDGVVIRK